MIIRTLARTLVRGLREVALTVLALLGFGCVVITVGGLLLDVQPLIFRSGSMAPTIPTGALALSRPVSADRLAIGDVVTVRTAAGTLVTHRIVGLAPAPDGASRLTLRGDANRVPDAEPYDVRTADRVVVAVPGVGYVVGALQGGTGLFVLGLLGGAVLVVGWRRRTAPTVITSGLVMISAALLLPLLHPTPAAAAFDDQSTARGTFTTVTVPAPTMTCTTVLVTVRFTWTAVANATGYVLKIYNPDGSLYSSTTYPSTTTTVALSGLLPSGTATIQAVRYPGSWTSAPSAPPTAFALGLLCG